MTFRQIIDVLRSRWWLVAVVTLVALGGAAGYLHVRTVSYTSTAVLRENVTFSQAAATGELGGVQVDFDPSSITTQKVLAPAAKQLNIPTATLVGATSYTVVPGAEISTINLAATGPTPAAAQERATAAVTQYSAYLQAQVKQAVAVLTQRANSASAAATDEQRVVTLHPSNSLAQTSLTTDLSNLQNATSQIQTIEDAGSPLLVMTSAQPGAAVGASRTTVLGVALVAGLIAGIGMALIRDQFDDRLRDDRDFEQLTGLRSLGDLVRDRRAARGKDLLPAAGVHPTALLESLRTVRTSIQLLLPQRSAVIVVTSAQPGEGKTFVSANLALSLARAGKKVALVGGDLRRPSLDRYFLDAAEGDGLASLLEKSSGHPAITAHDVDAVMHSTPFAGLGILPAGETTDGVGDLLASSDLGTVIAQLRKVADVVVIDSPPVLTVVDATLLAKYADGVVVVAGIRSVTRQLLAATVDALRVSGAPLLGIVANKSRRSVPRPSAAYYIKGAARRAA